jgi:hypothetical protein
MSWKANNRWQAFGLHLLISLLIFIALVGVIYFFWYPGFLFHYDGGLEGMKLIAGVDLVIGPSLTLLVYKVGKKTLRFDLACIAVLQLVCIGGGMWTVWQTRPVAVVFAGGEYLVTNQRGYEAVKVDMAKVPLLNGSWPVWLATDIPEEQQAELGVAWATAGGLQYGAELYMPYKDYVPRLAKSGMAFADMQKIYQEQVKGFEGQSNIRFYPATTSMYTGHVAVDITDGRVIDFFH